jgi:hypothetical protein
MASISPPLPNVAQDKDQGVIRLPEAVIKDGLMSDAQLETVLMAETAFGSDLPGKFTLNDDHRMVREDEAPDAVAYRKGYRLCGNSLSPSLTLARKFAINLWTRFDGLGAPTPADPRFDTITGLFSGICGQRAPIKR